MRYDDENKQPDSKRQAWEFVYPATEVATAAETNVKHHRERGAWWMKESQKSETELKKKGFEYRDRDDSLYHGVQIVGDPELAKRVAQCKERIESHKKQEDLYATWVRALKAVVKRGKSQELTLTIEDVLFFGL